MSEQKPFKDELDLTRLLHLVYATRVHVVIVVAVVSVAFWTLAVLLNLQNPTIHSFQTRLDLIFEGVENARYPNRTAFLLGDIIAPAVLQRVYQQNRLESFIEFSEFSSGFTVSPYTPDRELILGKFQQDTKGLSLAEIEESQSQLRRELERASIDGVVLTFTSENADAIPPELVEKIMYDVPGEWNRHRVNDLGVLRFDHLTYTSKVVNVELIEQADYLIAFEMVLDLIDLLQSNIDTIKSLANSFSALDPVSGLTVTDLERAVRDITLYEVAPLRSPVQSLGIAKDRAMVGLYFANRLIELKRARDVNVAKLANVEKSYKDYVKFDQIITQEGDQRPLSSGTMIPQFGAEFLDKIVDLTSAGQDIHYRQDLNSLQLEIANEIATEEAEIDRVRRILDVLSGRSSVSKAEMALRGRYVTMVNETLPRILEDLQTHLDTSIRLIDQIGQESLGIRGKLYRHAHGKALHSQSRNILSTTNLRNFGVLVFLTVLLVVPAALVRRAIKGVPAS